MVKQKRTPCKVKEMFKDFPEGMTLTEANAELRRRHPSLKREASTYICGQKSFANYLKTDEQRNNEAVYVAHKPTREEKIRTKMQACLIAEDRARTTYEKMEAKLLKLLAKQRVTTADVFDFHPENVID